MTGEPDDAERAMTDKRATPAETDASLEAALATSEAERQRLERELARRADRILALNDQVTQLGRELSRTRGELERIRRRRAVRAATIGADAVRDMVARTRGSVRAITSGSRGTGGSPRERRHELRRSPAAQAALSAAIAEDAPGGAPTTGPLVSIVIPTHDGLHLLREVLAGVDGLRYASVEIIVVDNASSDGTAAYLAGVTGMPIQVVTNERNETFSEANRLGVERATGELFLFLNDDVTPVLADSLGYMVQSILSDPAVAAVGARLIYPSRHGPRSGPMHVPADLTVQHAGIGFAHTPTGLRPVNLGVGRDPRSADASAVREVAAATAACLLVRRSAYEAAGGFARGYDYGLEDVDLCLRLREQGGRILYDGRAAFWHHESATQKRSERDARQERQLRNHRTLLDHWAPRLSRQVLIDLLDRTGAWSAEPLHVGLTVTRDDPAAGYGDWYTAHELGDALADLGCRVSYLERHDDAWYSPDPTIDVVVGLLEAHDIRRLPGHMVTVAWIRNWTDRWLARPWFDAYDLVLTSSETSRRLVEEGSTRLARRFPIATNPERFHPPDGRSEPTVDVAFTGNHWGQPRAVDQALPELVRAGRSVLLHGKGWEAVPSLQPLTRGPVPYDRLPAVYGGARLVVDDSPPFTARYGAVNSRVFDALAAGTLVISENEAGVRELFDADFPVWHDEASLREQVDALLADPDRRRTLVERYRAMVLEQHTYAHRALELLQALRSWATAPRCRILIGVPSWEVAPAWGDTHFARDLQRQLERLGIRTGVSILPEWDADQATRADAVIHLFGLKEFRPRPAQVSLLWVISHPDLVRDDQVARFDRVFVASDRFAARLSQRMAAERGSPPPIEALHQATDPGRFWPEAGGPAHELLFVGNSRGVERAIIRDLVPTGHDLAVYGGGWTPELLDPDYLKGVAIPNEDVHRYYASAAIVLNDHWPDMRESGFLSNRLYDALASGAFVISDHVDGIEAEFDEGVITYHDRDDLSRAIERYLADPDERRRIAGRGRAAVLQRHTFQLRAAVLGTAIREAVDARPATIVPLGPEAEVDASAVVAAPTPPTPGSDA